MAPDSYRILKVYGDSMIRKIVKVAAFCMCFSLLFGCAKGNKSRKQNEKVFSAMSQDRKRAYVADYLKERYGIETTILSVEKRQINSFSSEEDFFAIAKYNGTERIYCWISDEGVIADSKFVNDATDSINALFKQKIGNRLSAYKIDCKSTLHTPAKQTWDQDSVEEMLAYDDISTSVRIFVEKSEKETATNAVDNKFNNIFAFTTGSCYIYFVDNLEEVDTSPEKLVNYDLKFEFEKS